MKLRRPAVISSVILLSAFLFLFSHALRQKSFPVISPVTSFTVILDPGHGGEDGGASAPDGTHEKDLNLQISQAVISYFDWFGIRYQTTRNDDSLIGDNTLPTIRERKISDIRRRMQIVNDTPGSVLLSIHQNFFTSEKYSGTQVFYAPNAAGSASLADWLQHAVANALQPDNHRKIKPTEGTVFLLDRAEKTSVMVECGFLSNRTETEKLKDERYQSQIGYFIVRGVCDYFNNMNSGA